MKELFTLVEDTKEQVIIKNNAKTPLEVAQHPFVQSNYEYITVTKGDRTHILTVVRTDGSTFSFNWGNSTTLISENLTRLKKEVLSFIACEGIDIER